jgi:exopolysaccharide biosynthesis protein
LKLTGTDVEYIVSGYPILIQDSKKTKVSKSFFSRRRCPRTAIGIHPNGSVIIYVTTASTLKEVQTYLLTLGCTDAINLDGGSSTFLYLEGKKVYSSNQGRSYPNVLSW